MLSSGFGLEEESSSFGTLKVSFQGELHIQWESLPSFDVSYFSKPVNGAVKYYSILILSSLKPISMF